MLFCYWLTAQPEKNDSSKGDNVSTVTIKYKPLVWPTGHEKAIKAFAIQEVANSNSSKAKHFKPQGATGGLLSR